jgi:CRISPR system Cascade subunit CasE
MLWDLFTEEKERNFLYREEIAREQFGSAAGVRGEPVYYLVSAARPFAENPVFDVETRDYRPQLQEGDRLRFELRVNPVVTQKIERENPDHYLRERKHRPVADKSKITKKRIRHDVVMSAQQTLLNDLCKELNLVTKLPSSPEKKDFKHILRAYGGQPLDTRLTSLLENDHQYAERLQQKIGLNDKLEWSLKAAVDRELSHWIERQGESHGFVIVQGRGGLPKLQNSAYRWHELMKKSAKGKKSGFSSVDFVGELQVSDGEKFTQALFKGVGRSKAFGCGLMLIRRG